MVHKGLAEAGQLREETSAKEVGVGPGYSAPPCRQAVTYSYALIQSQSGKVASKAARGLRSPLSPASVRRATSEGGSSPPSAFLGLPLGHPLAQELVEGRALPSKDRE